MKERLAKINVPIAIMSLAISLLVFYIALPSWMTRRRQLFTVYLTSTPYGLDLRKFFIQKQQPAIKVHAAVTDQEYKDLSGVAYAEADLSQAIPGTNRYPVSLYPEKLRNLVKQTSPEEANTQALFTLESVRAREVRVSVTSSGKLNDPVQLVDTMVPETQHVQVEGPASDVARVVSARATLRLDQLDSHSSEPVLTALEPVDAQDRVVEHVDIHPAQVMVGVQFSLAPQTKQAFIQPVFGGSKVPAGYEVKSYSIDPNPVMVSGSSQSLAKIGRVSTEPIDLSRLTSTQTLNVRLIIPARDVSVRPGSVRVTVVIEPVALKNLNPKPSGTTIPTTAGPTTGAGR